MVFLREWHLLGGGSPSPRVARLIGVGLFSAALAGGLTVSLGAQQPQEQQRTEPSRGEKSLEGKLTALERERDDLKRRNVELELKLKQLQATVDDQVHQALGEQPSARPFVLPPSLGTIPRRSLFVGQFRPMFSPFNGTPDPVELAVAFSDALGEKESARAAVSWAKHKVKTAEGPTTDELEAASAQLLAADRKTKLLRNIIATARAVAADDVERMRKLGAARAVSTAEVRNAEARLKVLDEILATDPEAAAKPAGLPQAVEPKS